MNKWEVLSDNAENTRELVRKLGKIILDDLFQHKISSHTAIFAIEALKYFYWGYFENV